ncbi:2-dehydropantoate 2-reductase [Phreatobacter sp.]|uniref:2-dehydropantoate 2-reductase n=1 Tax=Phreatobacter sp. TaxID=1966341 RepID=UPI003F6EB8BD
MAVPAGRPAFIVVGAGAIGCHVGGRLAASGARVVFLAHDRSRMALAARGLSVTDLDGSRFDLAPQSLHLAGTPAEAALQAGGGPFVLLCVKGPSTEAAAAGIAAVLPPGTPVLSLQNGVDNPARIRSAAPGLVVLAGMVPFNVALSMEDGAPVTAHRGTSGDLHAEDHPAVRAVAPAFAAAGLPLTLSSDMAAVQWGKLLLNLNNPVNALSGLPLKRQLLDPDYRRVLAALQAEALAVMKAAGIRPAKIGAAPPALIPTILRLPTWAFSRIAASMLSIDERARSSMLDDIEAGRPTEIDDLCGAIVRMAERAGAAAPLNSLMIEWIRHLRAGEHAAGADLLARIAGPKAPL